MSAALAAPIGHDDGEVAIVAGGVAVSGWSSIRITRGIERMPSDFEMEVTERFPGQPDIILQPLQPCVVRIGGDTVVTGYVDRYGASIGPGEHTIRINGRGKCQDLVDCSAVIHAMQLSTGSMAMVAQALATPFGITVSSNRTIGLGSPGSPVPQFNVNLGETPFELIDRIARWAGVLAYEDAAGNLVLADAGTSRHASGFEQGVNVEGASVTFSADERFSLYTACIMSAQQFSQIPGADGNTQGTVLDPTVGVAVPTPGKRFRPRIIISEQFQNGESIALKRATWEMNRRNGRSRAVTLTCDSWRDSAGKLWEPNYLVPLHIPALKIENQTWLIGEVTYRRGEDGTHADLLLMPPAAYQPEPEVLAPTFNQIAQAIRGGAAVAP